MGCGIRDLRKRITNFLGDMSNFSKEDNENKIFSNFLSCNLSILLPYRWRYLTINTPKGFKLKEYVIALQTEDNYKSEVKIRLDKINAILDSEGAIHHLLEMLL